MSNIHVYSDKAFMDRLEELTKGRSQSDIARKVGGNRKTIYEWKNGISSPRVTHIIKLAKVLGCINWISLRGG